MTTETIDKLYLELSQITSARNELELLALHLLEDVYAGRKIDKRIKGEIYSAIVLLRV